ncbi:hypothetical protein CEXT_745311 [Caerostris extrusa]|uniref:Uncharacterized protein n=1 Tax=Caerostris extrusa TaxID=172846 RepID=A0AAV4VAE8_CAEEX|nr:hypothetical protein CEXT_745311 [Caerostris extrusa]
MGNGILNSSRNDYHCDGTCNCVQNVPLFRAFVKNTSNDSLHLNNGPTHLEKSELSLIKTLGSGRKCIMSPNNREWIITDDLANVSASG